MDGLDRNGKIGGGFVPPLVLLVFMGPDQRGVQTIKDDGFLLEAEYAP
jgi:hypothetical protein